MTTTAVSDSVVRLYRNSIIPYDLASCKMPEEITNTGISKNSEYKLIRNGKNNN